MGMNYTLQNINVEMATAVLVKNVLADTPTQTCGGGSGSTSPAAGAKTKNPSGNATAAAPEPGPEPVPTPNFVYAAWQFLNPSPGAEEWFAYNNVLSIVIKKTFDSGTIQSKRTLVQVGSSYTVAIGESDITIQSLPQNGKDYVEVVTPPPSVDPFTLNVEWYLGGLDPAQSLCVGITQGIGPDTSAFFQPDNGTLLFLPVAANKAGMIFTPADVVQATAYQAPSYATHVQVAFQTDEAGKASYTFDPPNAASQE